MNEWSESNESSGGDEQASRPAHGARKIEIASPGEMLREARLAHDYSVEDLCADTKLTPKSVRALEENDFSALSQPVFARGYYRQCGKVLDMDIDRLMAAYTEWVGDSQPRPPEYTRVNVQPEDVTPQHWRHLAVIAVIAVVVLAIVAIFVFTPGGGPAPGGGTAATGAQAGHAGGAKAQANAQSGNSSGNGNASGQTGQGGQLAGSVNKGGLEGPNNAASQNRPAGGRNVNPSFAFDSATDNNNAAHGSGQQNSQPQVDPNHLKLTFTDRSWISVRDATGSRLARGIYEKGDTRELDGKPPYDLVLGFAPGVEVRIGGKPVDVKAHTRSDTTARFSVQARGDN